MTKADKLQNAVFEAMDILDSLDIDFGPIDKVSINRTAKGRWGQCCYDHVTKKYSININEDLLSDAVPYKALMNTVLHEFLHAHEDRMCHTGEWKACANLVNIKYGYNIKRTTSSEEVGLKNYIDTSYKYRVVCDKCETVTCYKKKSRVVRMLLMQPKDAWCHCNVCGGRDFTVYSRKEN